MESKSCKPTTTSKLVETSKNEAPSSFSEIIPHVIDREDREIKGNDNKQVALLLITCCQRDYMH